MANSRQQLSAHIQAVSDAWRVLGRLGLLDTIFNHISYATPDLSGNLQIILNPAEMFPHEVGPEHLRVFPLRNYLPSDAERLGVNADGLQLHTLIHSARMRPGTIVHTHSLHSLAVGCSEQGLLPLSQTAIEFFGALELLEYEGVFRSNSLTDRLEAFAKRGGAALMRNHGVLVVADTIPEAVYLTYFLEEACRIQVVVLSQGVPTVLPSDSAIQQANRALRDDRKRAAESFFQALCRQFGV